MQQFALTLKTSPHVMHVDESKDLDESTVKLQK